MTNFEHMTDEEKKLAIIYGIHRTMEGDVKPCPSLKCSTCPKYRTTCDELISCTEREAYLNKEYEPPKTENEKFCETLKVGEVIAVSDIDVMNTMAYNRFTKYDADKDRIVTGVFNWKHGRKLTAEERGE